MSSNVQIRSMYRRALRLTKTLEGQRRRRLSAFRTKEILTRAMLDIQDPSKVEAHLLDADFYLDNIEAQAKHLRSLDPNELLIPVDLYKSDQSRKVILGSLPGRRLSEEERHGNVKDVLGGRLFEGPEPSWIRNKKLGNVDGPVIPRPRERKR